MDTDLDARLNGAGDVDVTGRRQFPRHAPAVDRGQGVILLA
jgi:hypothetical protein